MTWLDMAADLLFLKTFKDVYFLLFQSGGLNSSVWGAAAHYRQLLQHQHQQLQQHAEDEVSAVRGRQLGTAGTICSPVRNR